MQLGVLGRASVEPITPGPSRIDRLLGAVAQWQFRLCFYIFGFLNMERGTPGAVSSLLIVEKINQNWNFIDNILLQTIGRNFSLQIIWPFLTGGSNSVGAE